MIRLEKKISHAPNGPIMLSFTRISDQHFANKKSLLWWMDSCMEFTLFFFASVRLPSFGPWLFFPSNLSYYTRMNPCKGEITQLTTSIPFHRSSQTRCSNAGVLSSGVEGSSQIWLLPLLEWIQSPDFLWGLYLYIINWKTSSISSGKQLKSKQISSFFCLGRGGHGFRDILRWWNILVLVGV